MTYKWHAPKGCRQLECYEGALRAAKSGYSIQPVMSLDILVWGGSSLSPRDATELERNELFEILSGKDDA